MDGMLTRAAAAKMISNFAMNLLGMKPDTTRACTFSDTVDQDGELQKYMTLSCQLGLMGLNNSDRMSAKTFEPGGFVNKAQFATIISRMLYGDTYNSNDVCWYCKHVDVLKSNKIINITTDLLDPFKRGRAMLMLKRIHEK